jgi:hypothetical protein
MLGRFFGLLGSAFPVAEGAVEFFGFEVFGFEVFGDGGGVAGEVDLEAMGHLF